MDGVDLPLLKLMRRAGCRLVAYGVESGNPETLSMLRKDVTLDETRRAFAETRAAGQEPQLLASAHHRTLAFCREIQASYVQFSTLTAFPGTPLFASAHERAGSVKNPVDGDLNRSTLSDLPPEELQRLLRRAWMDFYLRPTPMLRLTRDALRSGSVDEAWRLSRAFGRWALAA